MSVFEFVPVAVVDAGLVPDEHDLAAFGCAVAKLVGAASLDDGDAVSLLFAVLGIGHAEAAHVMIAHVHAEEVSGGDEPEFAFGVFALRIEAGGVVVMAVHGVKVPVIKFPALGVGIGNPALHGSCTQTVARGDVGESARAFEGSKEMARLDVGDPLVGMKLQELMPGGGTAQTAQHAELAVVDVGNVGASVWARGLGIELENIREESCGKLIVNV